MRPLYANGGLSLHRVTRGHSLTSGICLTSGKVLQKIMHRRCTGTKNQLKKGNASAQYALGWMYENAEGVKKDYGQAFIWYLKAAKKDKAAAY